MTVGKALGQTRVICRRLIRKPNAGLQQTVNSILLRGGPRSIPTGARIFNPLRFAGIYSSKSRPTSKVEKTLGQTRVICSRLIRKPNAGLVPTVDSILLRGGRQLLASRRRPPRRSRPVPCFKLVPQTVKQEQNGAGSLLPVRSLGKNWGTLFRSPENLGFTFNPDGRADLQSAQVRRNLFLRFTTNKPRA